MIRASTIARACCLNDAQFFAYMEKDFKATRAMDEGTILHSMILERKFPYRGTRIINANDYRAKASQEAKKRAVERGKLPLLKMEYTAFMEYDFTAIRAIFQGGRAEVELRGSHPLLGSIGGRCDYLTDSRHIYDLKCTNLNTFSRPEKEIFYSAYDVQLYIYMSMARAQTASIVFFNYETGCFQIIDMHMENIREKCKERINDEAYPRIMRWKMYQEGHKQLETIMYYPQWR